MDARTVRIEIEAPFTKSIHDFSSILINVEGNKGK